MYSCARTVSPGIVLPPHNEKDSEHAEIRKRSCRPRGGTVQRLPGYDFLGDEIPIHLQLSA